MITLKTDPMQAIKQAAYSSMMSYFNQQAIESAHIDMAKMLAIVRGSKDPHPIEARDEKLKTVAQAILKANTPEEVDAVMKAMENPQEVQ